MSNVRNRIWIIHFRRALVALVCMMGIALLLLLAPVARDEISWRGAGLFSTVTVYQGYVHLNPSGSHINEAQARIAALRSDPSLYEAALRGGREASLMRFLAQYPGHDKEAEAQLVVKE